MSNLSVADVPLSAPDVAAPLSMDQIHQTIHAYCAAISALDQAAWLATFATDAISHEPQQLPLQGHAALGQFFQDITAAFNTVKMTAEQIFVVRDSAMNDSAMSDSAMSDSATAEVRAAVHWRVSSQAKTGRAVTFAGINIFHINAHGKIQTLWGYWDPAAMIAQMSAPT